MQIHDLNTGTPASGHYIAMDSGSDTYKATPGNIVPSYTSGDSSTATSWSSVTTVGTGLSFSTLINRITTMMKNVRYLYNVLGSSTFSTVASTITGAIGNTALGTTATTLSGAIAEHESDISTLNSNLNKGEESGSGGYSMFPDGTLIQWGAISVQSGEYRANVPFPKEFIDRTKISVNLTPIQIGTDYNVNYVNLTTSILDIGRTPSTNTDTYYWLAIGRWKP